MAHRILVVDDDPHIREVICFALEKGGMATSIARDGREAVNRFRESNPDLIVLDIGMPEMDGLEVCRQIRKTSNVPILFLSARDEEIDRILGLEIGGDDYVTKPFSPRELVTRVNVILRRRVAREAPAPETKLLAQGVLSMDALRHAVTFNGSPVTLTAIEFTILKSFLTRPGIVLTREQIMNAAYDTQIYVSNRTIDSHIRNIRVKFAAAGCASIIDTVHGVGFRLGPCEAAI
ncbi:response regulator [Microvirga splendida]|uniref:Response regulator transcription factor n=1 Tax=Microvirga splendida TaxID=2795727 RepID=A0ABS0Y566_9HYPH|nr:response regulator transcription factor [Microvirga splendida]